LIFAVPTFFGIRAIGTLLMERFYLSETSVTARLDVAVGDFRDFVAANKVASTDVNAVGRWNQENHRVQLTVFGMNTTINSSSNGAELVGNEYGLVIRAGDLAKEAREYAVKFSDGVYTVAFYDSSRAIYMWGVNLACVVFAAVVFLAIVLLYDQHLTRTVQALSRQVRQVSRGDLQMQIRPATRDEIGQLALDVDAMRLSIIDKLHREEMAWQANSQLITAISHDVRTPLTALMGYLEILGDDTLAQEERQAYLEICKNNAHRLKGLTDELFGFFLVFGRPNPEQVLEEFDGAMLLDQILMEHEMDLTQQGYDVRTVEKSRLEGKIRVDLGHLRRVFDNLFSNVKKYADPQRPVSILREMENGELHVTMSNRIPRQANWAESNRIGLQTCQKLVDAMGGRFCQSKTGDTFTVEVILPLIKE
jgi:signal transduction histidine kinase